MASSLTFGSLFAGIGGFDLGLERAGMSCKWQVEIDPYCRQVLAKHWPDVDRYEDVREVGRHNLESVDLICGGFPCQDVSQAGRRKGIAGDKSGLWDEFDRIIRDLRPRWVLIENTDGLRHRGFGRVLRCLAESGFDAAWQMFPAAVVGAPHCRERVFIVAAPIAMVDAGRLNPRRVFGGEESWPRSHPGMGLGGDGGAWAREPRVARTAYGVPNRTHRLRALGNAVVPQVAEWIGRRIVAAHAIADA